MSRPQSQASERPNATLNKSKTKLDLLRSGNNKPVIIPTNSKGGVLVTKEELQLAFNYFDKKKKGNLTKSDLKDAFAQPGLLKMNEKELKTILPDGGSVDYNTLEQLLVDNDITDFDPAKEAFKVF
jgi:hypothetical protein